MRERRHGRRSHGCSCYIVLALAVMENRSIDRDRSGLYDVLVLHLLSFILSQHRPSCHLHHGIVPSIVLSKYQSHKNPKSNSIYPHVQCAYVCMCDSSWRVGRDSPAYNLVHLHYSSLARTRSLTLTNLHHVCCPRSSSSQYRRSTSESWSWRGIGPALTRSHTQSASLTPSLSNGRCRCRPSRSCSVRSYTMHRVGALK